METNYYSYKFWIILIVPLFLWSFFSCEKYLDEKSDGKLSTPETIQDLQAILDNISRMNVASALLNTNTDEYYLKFEDWQGTFDPYKSAYVWASNTDVNSTENDWNLFYTTIFYANTILDNLDKISSNVEKGKYNSIKGAALFFRAHCFFQVAQLYAPQYNKATAATDPGIVLRLSSNFNTLSARASVEETYAQITNDLDEAVLLLPEDVGYKSRPNKPAALGLLARTYLIMQDYIKAKECSNASLNIFGNLFHYKDLINNSAPFKFLFEETIFYTGTYSGINGVSLPYIDTTLYNSFSEGDLRKELFFEPMENGFLFKGNYTGSYSELFNGIATDEMYLTRSESNARLGNLEDALKDLNDLIATRWDPTKFVPYNAETKDEVLQLILMERRKELIFRGTRWSDLRRLNLESTFSSTIQRRLGNQEFTLKPNDLRYTMLIPQEVIRMTGISQNRR